MSAPIDAVHSELSFECTLLSLSNAVFLRSHFITVLLQNNLPRLQLFVIILNYLRISNRPQQAQDVNAVLFNMN